MTGEDTIKYDKSEWEAAKYAQEQQAKISDINALEIAFGNLRDNTGNDPNDYSHPF